MDSVNDRETVFFYIVPNLKEDVRAAGRACVKAFGVRSRCTHLEFFRLLEDKPGLGKKGGYRRAGGQHAPLRRLYPRDDQLRQLDRLL